MAVKRICMLFIIIHLVVKLIECTHFRGATFSWIPVDGNSISINFRISWRRSSGSEYNCTDATIFGGNLIGDSYLTCFSGCSGTVGSLQFKCTDYDIAEDWTTGRNTITFTSSSSQFSFGFTGGDWISLLVGGSSWSLLATVNLTVRSDTRRINSSPTVDVPPLLKWQYGCKYNLLLPVSDVDGDAIKCRWASGYTECAGICNSFPGTVLNETACSIEYTFNKGIGYYGVALQIEDFASATSTTPLSSIPLQFLIQVYSRSGCTSAPEFISPTPNENQYFSIFVRDLFSVTIKARSAIQLNAIITTSAIGMVRSSEVKSSDNSWKYIELNVTWSPTVNDAEQDHSLCFFATDIYGASSSTRCIRIQVSDIDDCQSNPCQNGGTCADKINRYLCNCIPGYTGYNCEDEIQECDSSPCQYGGKCFEGINMYTCSCMPGYTGKNCQTNINECSSSPCQNAGTCIDRVNGYTCACVTGFTGTNCQINIYECSSSPCQNAGTCIDRVNGYTCACVTGFIGTNCQTNINECSSSPCQNAGTCIDRVNGYTCACVTGFTGTNCQTNIDECSSSPCRNGGYCTDVVNGYTCACKSGFAGSNCQTDINECGSSPCQNGGNCMDLINAYFCACRIGFTGSNCQTDVDECKSSPCQNGGTCIDGQNRYVCLCDSRFHGSVCQNVASHYGTEFYIGMINVYNGNEDIRIDIASKKNGNMTISVPYLDLDEISNVRSGVTTVYINQSLIESGSFTDARGIRIITDIDVAIFVTGIDKLSSNIRDTYLALPVSALERDYVVASYTPADFVARSEYVLMSVSDNTTVTILNNNVTDSTANVNLFDIHQVSDPRDLTGQAVFGNQKIAMISGTSCAYIPTGVRPCNFLIEQMIPMEFWTNYFIVPSMLPKRGFLLRILSPMNITSSHCFTNTSGTLCKDFDTFSYNENLFESDVVVVVSNIASSVVQYGVGTGFDNIPGNPFMMVVPGINNYFNEYVFVIPEVFPKGINYLCIIIPTSAERGLLLDGELVNSSYDHQSVPDPFRNFTVLKLIIGTGFHNVTHADKTIYFGALVYGIAENVGYGYPVGYRYGPDLELCSLRPCKNGGYCSKKIHGYTCSCKPGFTGSHCEKDINECSSNPCQNGATCHDEISRFRCACAPGFFGILCNIETNECSSMPCQNGGTCVDIVNGFECECVDGFNGQTCEKEIDECKSSPCLNGATCTDGLNNFTCICASGYIGDICEVDINECSSFPCQNGGHCTDEINRYTCLCEPGFHGKQCQNVSTHYGTEFYIGILALNDSNVNVRISIASKSEGNLTFKIPFQDRIEVIQFSEGVTTINVNTSLARTGTFIENRGIYLRTDVDVAVFVTSFDLSSLNSINSYLALPLSVLDNQYVLESEKDFVNVSGLIVVAVYDNTTIYLIGNTLDHLTVSLQELDLYQYTGLFESGRVEMTGNKKFAVISGYALCEACSVMATQILPRLLWTNYFIIPTRVNMEKYKIIITSSGSRNISYCLINSTRTTCIDNYGYVNNEVTIGSDTIVLVSNTNVSIILYETMNQNTYSNVLSVIPGVSNYLNEYYFVVTSDSTSSNFLYIIAPTEEEDGLLLDNNYINSTFDRIYAPDNITKYSVINMAIDGGYHHLNHENASIKFGALIYTFGKTTQHLYSAGFGWESVTQLCSFNPCQNYGVCNPTAAGYTCFCLSGYTGGHCQTDINECSSFPCQNGGKCSDGINTFTCTCTEAFYGRLCETEIDACFSFPCQHDGSCVADNKNFRCYCPSGFGGLLCEEEINECYSSPCLHGGTCFDMVNGYTCTCDAGYIGSVCETDINECSSNPCQNGGACADSINGYACLCRQGFTGSNCQTDVKECSSNPCQNEGECIDVINGFSCNCTNGYFGPECEFEVDECLSSPCENGGICEDNINGYTCLCHKWFQGRNCQKVSSNLGREFAVIISYSIIPNMDFLRFDIASKSEGKAIIVVVNSSFRNEVDLYKGVTTINLNDSVFVSDIETLKRAISISADTDVAVFVSAGGKNFSEIRDGYLALPVTALASYYGFDPFISWNMSAIVIALNDETEINVSRSSGNLSSIHLNSFDIYRSSADIYDMELSGNKEFAVIFGSLCSNCTFVVEQMIPNAFWTNVFIVPSILLQKQYQILHSGNLNSSYCIDNSKRSYCSKLNTVGQSDAFVAIDTVVVTSEKAISVLQKWKGLMVMIPGISNYLNEFVFAVPYVKQNSTCYLCVIVPASSERGIMIDENPIESAYHKQRISNSLLDYTVFHLIINEGYHYLTHENQSVKFGAILYCIDDNNCYGFPVGFGYGPDLYTCSVKVFIPEEECVNTTSDLVCSCSAGFTGSNCQTDVNECNFNPCQNGGSCTDQITGFKCHCANGYRGVLCEQDIDECEYNPCKNGATCHNLIDSYNCLCTDGFDGKMCEIDVNECSSVPCQNTGICSDIVNGYTCTCIAGYYGMNCEHEIDECRSSPCQHGGNCTDSVNGFICACTPGFAGRTCMIDIDECNSNPCSHGSSCTDLENGFVCSCVRGFDGLLCKNDINECASSPCRNGGSCIDSVNDYTCICEPGYNGSNCDQEINECAPDPCMNEGSCSDGVNNYTCSCLDGFYGRNCEHGTSLSPTAPYSMTSAIVGSVVGVILAVVVTVAVVITVKRKCPMSRFQQKRDVLGQIVKENPVYFDNQFHLEDDDINTRHDNVEDKTSESAT